MKHGTLVLPVDRARHFIDLIGSETNMQFEDMNARSMRREYKKYIQRIDEMERILRFLTGELAHIPGAEETTHNIDDFLKRAGDYKLDEVEARLKQIHQEFIQFKENNAVLTARMNAALEERYVVQTASASMARVSSRTTRGANREEGDQFEFQASRSLLDDEEGGSGRRALETMFNNVAGVIPQVDQDRFARGLFRATRGNTFTHFQQIPEPMLDPKTGAAVQKSVFVIYFQDQRAGAVTSAMSEKVTKICKTFGVNTYSWPTSREEAEEVRAALQAQVEDHRRLITHHEIYVRQEAGSLLERVGIDGNSLIEDWRLFCMKEKSIYSTLNMFEGDMNLRANCWYPEAEEDQIRAQLIRHSSQQHGHSSAMLVSDRGPPRKMPPTYIRRNQFTCVFQDLVDMYGCPGYQEANPMLFSVVTFPFLFGIMYGDIGHGSILFAFGLFLVWTNAPGLKGDIKEVYKYRYLLAMMGFFAVYAGFLYNDVFSVGLNLFGSRWKHAADPSVNGKEQYFIATYDVKNMGGAGPYPFGVDPAWHGSTNELVFMNSLKMKLSVVIGVAQMILGLFLRWSNAFHFKKGMDFACECIPMMIFILSFFGYMDYMILYKWVTPMENPPSIINALISMSMWQPDNNPMFNESVPRVLMVITALMVPWMLIPKPMLIYSARKAQTRVRVSLPARPGHGHGSIGAGGGHGSFQTLEDEEAGSKTDDEEEEHFDFSDVVIHQVIETIEYVLGTVSHTASYLRLWALSLAHQQLSLVFFQKTLGNAMSCAFPLNVVALYIASAVWFVTTMGILLGMDVMECALHTLRLHWVEFQTKFYKADGYKFEPYSHRAILEEKCG